MNGPSGREEWDAEMAWWPGGWTDGSGASYSNYVSYGELGPEERAAWRREQEAAQAQAEAARAAELAEWEKDAYGQEATAAFDHCREQDAAARAAEPDMPPEHDWEAGA